MRFAELTQPVEYETTYVVRTPGDTPLVQSTAQQRTRMRTHQDIQAPTPTPPHPTSPQTAAEASAQVSKLVLPVEALHAQLEDQARLANM